MQKTDSSNFISKGECGNIEKDRDYSGNDLRMSGNAGRIPKMFATAEECRQACAGIKDCVGFVFVKSVRNDHNCAVKSKWVPDTGKSNDCCDSGEVTEVCRKKYQGLFKVFQKLS